MEHQGVERRMHRHSSCLHARLPAAHSHTNSLSHVFQQCLLPGALPALLPFGPSCRGRRRPPPPPPPLPPPSPVLTLGGAAWAGHGRNQRHEHHIKHQAHLKQGRRGEEGASWGSQAGWGNRGGGGGHSWGQNRSKAAGQLLVSRHTANPPWPPPVVDRVNQRQLYKSQQCNVKMGMRMPHHQVRQVKLKLAPELVAALAHLRHRRAACEPGGQVPTAVR